MPSDTPQCPAQTCDEAWNNVHFCTHESGHDGDHQCLCGHHWPNTQGS